MNPLQRELWIKAMFDRVAKLASPERAFLILGAVCGLVFTFVTPPFQTPDEPQHFYRAYQFSELQLADVSLGGEQGTSGTGYTGALLPKSLSSIVSASDLISTRFQAVSKLIPSKVFAAVHIPLEKDQRTYLPVPGYPPAGYIPQAVGISIGRVMGLPPLLLMYCGRIFSLGAWLLLVWLAIRRTPVLKWALFLLALMPMTIHMAASNSIDGFVIGLTFLAGATLLQWVYDDTKPLIGRTDVAWLALMGVGICLSKAIYLSVMFLFVLVPQRKFRSRTSWALSFALCVLAGSGSYSAWNWFKVRLAAPGPAIDLASHAVDTSMYTGISPSGQVQFLLSNPTTFGAVVGNTIETNGIPLFHSFVGQLGWLDTVLPLWLPYLYIGMLIAASASASRAGRVSPVARLTSGAIFVATATAMLLLIYISTNPVGADKIGHLQGRYFIPVAPLFFLIFCKSAGTAGRYTCVLWILFSMASTAMAANCVLKRFYWGEGFAYQIERVSISPEENLLKVTGWAAARNGGDVSGGIELGVDGRYFPVRSGIDRPDLAESWGEAALRFSGFEGAIESAGIDARGELRIDLRIKTSSGKTYVVPDPRIVLNRTAGEER